ncbi:MAG: hypothetical protein H6713_16810 [Myxococcales bacterium]|nr:hypothetical protein [Myxococcales bacterium]
MGGGSGGDFVGDFAGLAAVLLAADFSFVDLRRVDDSLLGVPLAAGFDGGGGG